MKKVSVIIPVYNVEKYLSECVDSVLHQSYQNFEIILVDDGSKDKSGEICDRYASSDSRISVIHKENGGLSDARNRGLEAATGDCVIFLDSDDFLCETALEDTVRVFENEKCDFLFFDALSFNDENRDYNIKQNYIRKQEYATAKGIDILCAQLKNKEFHSSACMMLINTAFLKQNKILFCKGILYEDMLFTYELYVKAEKVCRLNKAVYHRRYREKSIMTSRPKAKNFISAKTVFENVCALSEAEKITESDAAKLYLPKCAYNAMNIFKRLEKSERKTNKSAYNDVKALCAEHSFFGDTALKMRCKGKAFWFIYKVLTKIFKVK